MKVISIIKEQEQSQINSFQELWNSFNEAEWRNIFHYYMEQDSTQRASGNLASRTNVIRNNIDGIMRRLERPNYFVEPDARNRFIQVLRSANIQVDSQATYQQMHDMFAPHRTYRSTLPAAGPTSNMPTTSPYTQMTRDEFITAVNAAGALPETFSTEDTAQGGAFDAAVRQIVNVMLDNEDRRSGTPSWEQLALRTNNRIKTSLSLALSRYVDSLSNGPKPSRDLVIAMYYWLVTADDLVARLRRSQD